MCVAIIDQCSFDCWEFLADLLDVGIEVLLIVFQFLFHPFLTDKEPGKAGEQQPKFLRKRHRFLHVGEELLLCVGVNEGDLQLRRLPPNPG
jgi:hypothetical protein